MTKSLLCAAAAAMMFLPLTSCSDDDPKIPSGPIATQAAVQDTPDMPVINQIGDPTRSKNGLYYEFNYDNGEKLSVAISRDNNNNYVGAVNLIDGDIRDAVIPASVVVPMTKNDGTVENVTVPITEYAPQYDGIDDDIRNLYIPATCAKLTASTFTNYLTTSNLENIYIQAGADMPFCSINGAVYTADMKTFVSCPAGRRDYFAIANGTETVASRAFQMCKRITSITFPASVTEIQSNAVMFDFKILVLNMLGNVAPQAPADAFGYYVHNAVVRVPMGLEDAYNAVEGFAACKKVEGYDFQF